MADPVLSAVTSGDETRFFVKLPDASKFVEIGEITNVPEFPSGTQSTYKTTHMQSGEFEETKKNKRREGNEAEITGNYIIGGAAEATLVAMEDSVNALEYVIVTPQSPKVWGLRGFALFMNLQRTNPPTEARQFTISAKWVTKATVTEMDEAAITALTA